MEGMRFSIRSCIGERKVRPRCPYGRPAACTAISFCLSSKVWERWGLNQTTVSPNKPRRYLLIHALHFPCSLPTDGARYHPAEPTTALSTSTSLKNEISELGHARTLSMSYLPFLAIARGTWQTEKLRHAALKKIARGHTVAQRERESRSQYKLSNPTFSQPPN
ncbi:unnamed protein product [Lepidochelys kempii]